MKTNVKKTEYKKVMESILKDEPIFNAYFENAIAEIETTIETEKMIKGFSLTAIELEWIEDIEKGNFEILPDVFNSNWTGRDDVFDLIQSEIKQKVSIYLTNS